MLRKHIVAVICAATMVVVACVTLTGPDGEELEGLSVAATAAVLRGVADDVELWDVNKDGLIDSGEGTALGFGAGARVLAAMLAQAQAQSAEADPDR